MPVSSRRVSATWRLTDNQRTQLRYLATHRATSHYILHRIIHLQGPVAVDRLSDAVTGVTSRHQVLRARFDLAGPGDSCLIVDDDAGPFAHRRHNIDGSAGVRDGIEALPTVDLEKGPPWRCVLIERGPEDFLLHVAASHLVFDAQSFRVLYSDLSALYRKTPLPPLAAQFDAQVEWLNQRRLPPGSREFAGRLAELAESRLPWLATDATTAARTAEPHVVPVPQLRWPALVNAARSYAATPFTLSLAAFGDALCQRVGEQEVLIGLPFAARRFYGADQVIGDFSNTLLVRVRSRAAVGGGWASLMAFAKAEMSRAYAFSHVHVNDFLRELGTDRAFDVRFEVAASDSFEVAALKLPDVVAQPHERPATTYRRALAVALVRGGDDALSIRSYVTRHAETFGADAGIAEQMAKNLEDIVDRRNEA